MEAAINSHFVNAGFSSTGFMEHSIEGVSAIYGSSESGIALCDDDSAASVLDESISRNIR